MTVSNYKTRALDIGSSENVPSMGMQSERLLQCECACIYIQVRSMPLHIYCVASAGAFSALREVLRTRPGNRIKISGVFELTAEYIPFFYMYS